MSAAPQPLPAPAPPRRRSAVVRTTRLPGDELAVLAARTAAYEALSPHAGRDDDDAYEAREAARSAVVDAARYWHVAPAERRATAGARLCDAVDRLNEVEAGDG